MWFDVLVVLGLIIIGGPVCYVIVATASYCRFNLDSHFHGWNWDTYKKYLSIKRRV
jgi:hypothetical protein